MVVKKTITVLQGCDFVRPQLHPRRPQTQITDDLTSCRVCTSKLTLPWLPAEHTASPTQLASSRHILRVQQVDVMFVRDEQPPCSS